MPAKRQEPAETTEERFSQEIDSKYRLIILAAKRSKQLQRGARPRIDIDPTKHKHTRIALEEVIQGKIQFYRTIPGEPTRLSAPSLPRFAAALDAPRFSAALDAPRLVFPDLPGSPTALTGGLEGNSSTDIPRRRRTKSSQREK